MKKYLKLMRVRHYIKNLLIFAALACSGQLFRAEKLLSCVLGFISFCLVASSVYIFNDIRDAEKDRKHPEKCKRPIAAGTVSKKSAWILFAVLLAVATVISCLSFHYVAVLLLTLYLAINLAYSFGLKSIAIVDIAILVAGYLIRVFYGAYITGISISNWLYLAVITISLYFALGKRRNELKQMGDGNTRAVLKQYPMGFLDKGMGMCLTLTNVFYALWSMNEKTISMYGSKYLAISVPIVLLITLKYSLDVEGDSDGDPVEVLFHDKTLIVLCALYLLFMFVTLYM